MVLLTAAAAFLVLGTVRGQRLWKPGGLGLQATGFFVFGAIGLVVLYVALGAEVYLVAFALLAHSAWDASHYARDRVVTRSYTEYCAVVTFLVGAAGLFVVFVGWPRTAFRKFLKRS